MACAALARRARAVLYRLAPRSTAFRPCGARTKKKQRHCTAARAGSHAHADGALLAEPKGGCNIHIMLGALPFLPLPVVLEMDHSAMRAEELEAFVVLTLVFANDSARGNRTVNSNSLFAVLGLFHKWSGRCADNPTNTRAKMAKKDYTLELVDAALSCRCGPGCAQFVGTDARAAEMFLATTRAWIAWYLPGGVTVAVRLPAQLGVLREGPLHVSMAHYCHAQGVFYSSKGSLLVCAFHQQLQADTNTRSTFARWTPRRDNDGARRG